MKLLRIFAIGACATIAFAQSGFEKEDDQGHGQGKAVHETYTNHQNNGNGNAGFSFGGSRMQYHGGPVMGTTSTTSPVNVYFIWYGNWTNQPTNLLTNLITGLSGSRYFNINTTYFDASNAPVRNAVSLKGQTTDNYSRGTSLSDSGVLTVVQNATKTLGTDPNGIYFVLTSSDVNESSGFCTQYCGWHTATSGGLKYAFVGNPARCLSSCAAQSTSPNGNPGVDGMASIVAHELEEATTDPQLNAWYDSRGQENADKCAWTFGTTSTAANGSKYNVVLGGTQYLIQRNWDNSTSSCQMSH